MSDYPPVSVAWKDACKLADDHWITMDKAVSGQLSFVTTVGYLCYADDEKIIVAQSIGKYHVGNVICIPQVNIIELKEIK